MTDEPISEYTRWALSLIDTAREIIEHPRAHCVSTAQALNTLEVGIEAGDKYRLASREDTLQTALDEIERAVAASPRDLLTVVILDIIEGTKP